MEDWRIGDWEGTDGIHLHALRHKASADSTAGGADLLVAEIAKLFPFSALIRIFYSIAPQSARPGRGQRAMGRGQREEGRGQREDGACEGGFGSLWVHFRSILGHFGITLGSFWVHFGVTLCV